MRLLATVPAGEMKSAGVHFQVGDVLYGRLRPYLNKVLRPLFEGLSSAEFIVFPPSPSIDQQFLQYVLNSSPFVSFASHLNEGDRPRVDFEQIGNFELALPPLAEQRRIVAEIEKHFANADPSCGALEASSKKLDKLISAALIRTCLLSNPGEIRFQPVGSVGGVSLGRQRAPKHHNGPTMRPYLRVANVHEDRVESHDINYMNFTALRRILREGLLLALWRGGARSCRLCCFDFRGGRVCGSETSPDCWDGPAIGCIGMSWTRRPGG